MMFVKAGRICSLGSDDYESLFYLFGMQTITKILESQTI